MQWITSRNEKELNAVFVSYEKISKKTSTWDMQWLLYEESIQKEKITLQHVT